MCTHTHAHTHAHMHTCTHAHVHIDTHMHTHMHRDIYMHMDTCTHARTHAHTWLAHTYTCTLSVCLSVTLSLPLSVDSWVLPSLSFKRSAKTPHRLASLKVWCVLVFPLFTWALERTSTKMYSIESRFVIGLSNTLCMGALFSPEILHTGAVKGLRQSDILKFAQWIERTMEFMDNRVHHEHGILWPCVWFVWVNTKYKMSVVLMRINVCWHQHCQRFSHLDKHRYIALVDWLLEMGNWSLKSTDAMYFLGKLKPENYWCHVLFRWIKAWKLLMLCTFGVN